MTPALRPATDRLLLRSDLVVLESAITNLLHNAIRAEPRGGVVEVEVRPPGEVRVIDHGPGVPPEDAERIFEPFWRGDERWPGAGLGLTIVREAAAAHGGSVSVEATPGGGATFVLRLSG